MLDVTAQTAGILLITVPAVKFGGMATILHFLTRRSPGYADNPLRRSMYRAGHAHAGVLVLFALVALLYTDASGFGIGVQRLVRSAFVLPPVLMPAGFFFSVLAPNAKRPSAMIWLVYAGAAALAVGTLTLGVGLLTR